jgi:hypothetical protein
MTRVTHFDTAIEKIASNIKRASMIALNMFCDFFFAEITFKIIGSFDIHFFHNVLHFQSYPPAVRTDRVMVFGQDSDWDGSLFSVSAFGTFVFHFSSLPRLILS